MPFLSTFCKVWFELNITAQHGGKKQGEERERLEQLLRKICGIQKENFQVKRWLISPREGQAAGMRQPELWSRACCAGRARSRDRTAASVTPGCDSASPDCCTHLEDSAALPPHSPLPY